MAYKIKNYKAKRRKPLHRFVRFHSYRAAPLIKKEADLFSQPLFCDPYRIQTCNLLIRSQMLYSVELRSQMIGG